MDTSAAWNVVLIDDEKDIRDVLMIALKDMGYRVFDAPDGVEGLALCEKKSPQIVITDIRMPNMDGLQVLEALKAKTPQIEVIVATAYGEIDLAIRALQLDASDFITKPINTEALHLALKRAQNRYTDRKRLADYTALLEREKAATHQELLKTLSFQRNLIENSMDGILASDNNDHIVTFNKSMVQMLGYTKSEVLHRMTLADFFFPGDEKRLHEALNSEKYGGSKRLNLYETAIPDRKGRKVPVQVSGTLLFEEKQTTGFVLFFRDLRELRKLEREMADQARILHQDKMMSLGRLAASVVHEINNPLSGILNYLHLMLQILNRGPLSEGHREKFRRYLELVENETARCSKIISSLLTFSRKSPPAFGEIQLEELLNRSVILSRHKLELSNIRLELSIDPTIPPVEGDYNQLQQCVINLIFNAIDAMPDGGTLTLSGGFDSEKKRVTIQVKDSGTGIHEKDLPHIFDPFFTTKQEGYGVGLGLSTVYGIMERHNGSVEVDSQPGQGAEFRLQLPIK